MNILYISFLNGDSWAGPTYSVPKQIKAQAEIDNVFWYNIRETKEKSWNAKPFYYDLNDYPNGTIHDLPAPFNKPDIIVVEQFYGYAGNKIIWELMRCGIPYVIIPRGELTQSAQKRKFWKKIIANLFLFEKFAQRAFAIEYLTEQEKRDSGDKWNKESIVIPNGICIPQEVKKTYCQNGIKCLSIGRIEPYHKGLDMLIEACGQIADTLKESSCVINIYGPDYDGKVPELKETIKKNGLSETIRIHDGLYGEEKKEELQKNDVFLLTSRFEGHPMALIEALAYGLPCIVTRGSNMKEEVEQLDAGWTAETNTEDIKQAILQMLDEKDKISQKAHNARSLAGMYDWNNIARRTHDCYMNLVKNKRKG